MTKQIKFKNLFVYGTLKEKGALHDHWLKDQTFMGTYYTEPNYFMFDYGPFPIVFPVNLSTGNVRREGNEGKRGYFEGNLEDFRFQS